MKNTMDAWHHERKARTCHAALVRTNYLPTLVQTLEDRVHEGHRCSLERGSAQAAAARQRRVSAQHRPYVAQARRVWLQHQAARVQKPTGGRVRRGEGAQRLQEERRGGLWQEGRLREAIEQRGEDDVREAARLVVVRRRPRQCRAELQAGQVLLLRVRAGGCLRDTKQHGTQDALCCVRVGHFGDCHVRSCRSLAARGHAPNREQRRGHCPLAA